VEGIYKLVLVESRLIPQVQKPFNNVAIIDKDKRVASCNINEDIPVSYGDGFHNLPFEVRRIRPWFLETPVRASLGALPPSPTSEIQPGLTQNNDFSILFTPQRKALFAHPLDIWGSALKKWEER
jgi:hypothetical protein